MRIGWIGSGLMGAPMIRRLTTAGHDLTVFSRSHDAPPDFEELGVGWSRRPCKDTVEFDALVTMVGGPADVEQLYFGRGGLIAEANPQTVLVDMTTSSPELATLVADAGTARGLRCLDAPVSGGPFGAESGTLSIMVGGPDDAFRIMLSVFDALGSTVVHHGSAGFGQRAKLINQLVVGALTMAVGEAFELASAYAMDSAGVRRSVLAGAAGAPLVGFLWDKLADGDRTPGFKLGHLMKDLNMTEAEASRADLTLELTRLVGQAVRAAVAESGPGVGSQLIGAPLVRDPGSAQGALNV